MRRFLAFERAEFAGWEMAVMRVLFAYVVVRYTSFMWLFDGRGNLTPVAASPFASQPAPVGLAQFFDLTFLSDPGAFALVRVIFYAGVVLYVAGVAVPIGLAAMLFANVTIATLNVSQGAIGHSGQVIGIPLLLQTVASVVVLAPRWGGLKNFLRLGEGAERLLVDWTRQGVVAVYLVTGLTKVITTGGEWATRGPLFAMQIEKAQTEAFSDHGIPMSESAQRVAGFLSGHPGVANWLLATALALELGAPLALLNRRLGALVALMLIGFHVANDFLMSLAFAENRWMLLIFFVNVPYWVAAGWTRVRSKWNLAGSRSTS